MIDYQYVDEGGDKLELMTLPGEPGFAYLVAAPHDQFMVSLTPEVALEVAQWLRDWAAEHGEVPRLKMTGETLVDQRDELVDEVALLRGTPRHDVYHRFVEEIEALTIKADTPAVTVVGDLTRAVKRAQMVIDGELAPVSER